MIMLYRYIFFGICTFLIDSGLFLFLSRIFSLQTSLHLHLASVCSTTVAIVFAYLTNRKFVFQSKTKGFYKTVKEFVQFFSARLFTLVFAELLMELTVVCLGWTDWIMKAGINLVAIVLNYLLSRFWVFKPKNDLIGNGEPYMKQLVVFDLDGTLVNSIYDIASAVNASLEIMGKSLHPLDAYYHMVGDGMAMLCRRALTDGREEEVQTLISLYKERYLKHCCVLTRPYDGIKELLSELKEKGILLAVLSNKPQEQTKQVVSTLFPEGTFAMVIGQSNRFPQKPDPTSLLYLIEEAGVLKENVCYIGDSDVDMQLGRKVGVKTIGVAWGFRGEEELQNSGADRIAYCPTELMEMIVR